MIPEKTLEIIQPKSKTVEYKTWWRIQNRCYNPNSESFKYYGGKGIKMCDKWKQSYESFLADMGRRPSKLHSIERKDGNKDYEPGNCYWATAKEQANNTSRNVYIEIDGINKTFAQQMKQPVNTHGGAREGAGRPAAKPKDRKVKIWFSIKASKEAQARRACGRIIDALNNAKPFKWEDGKINFE